jgi:sugar lactone lactonase YvrE
MDDWTTVRLHRLSAAALTRRRAMSTFAGGAALAALGATSGRRQASAQEATPAVAPPPGEVLVEGLMNPRGFTWSADGTLYVSLAGNGGDSAGVVTVTDGATTAVVAGQPSSVSDQGTVQGVADVAFIDEQLYLLLEGAGPGHDRPDIPTGVYAVGADGATKLVADLSSWIPEQTVAEPLDHEPYGNPFKMIAHEGALFVVSAAPDLLIKVTPAGEITLVADLTKDGGHQTRTGLVAAPDGGFYVSTLSNFPFLDGDAKVTKVEEDGTFAVVWTKLTAALDVAVTADGTLYAIEMTTGNSMDHPQNPGTGRLVRQTGPDTLEEVVTGLNLPVAMRLGADDMFYVAGPAWGSNEGDGWITRIGM